jgi:hypothetical protein
VSDRTTSTRSSKFRLRGGAVVVAGVLALGLSACGDDGGDTGSKTSASQGSEANGNSGADALKAVQLAATTSQKKSTANFKMSMDVTTDGQKLPVEATGQIDGANNALKLAMTMSVPGQGSMKLTEVVKGNTIYMTGIPGLGKKWVKLSLEEICSVAGGSGAGSLGTGTDPTDQLKLLTQVSNDVKEEGKETVNGVETTKYTGTIDLEKAAAASGADAKELAKVQKQYKDLGLKEIPFTLYVDGDNLPSRMTMKMNGKATANGKTQTIAMNTQMDFTDWGTDVKIATPKGAVSFEELLGSLGAGGGTTP